MIAAARTATLPEVWDALERWRERIDADARAIRLEVAA